MSTDSVTVTAGCDQGVHKVETWVRETGDGWAAVVAHCPLCNATFVIGSAQAQPMALFGPPVGPRVPA